MLCDYGCGKEALYQFKNGKWCCSKNIAMCNNKKKQISITQKERLKKSEVKITKLCKCGCNMLVSKKKNDYIVGHCMRNVLPWNKGKHNYLSNYSRKLISEASKKNNPSKYNYVLEERRQRMLNGQALKMIKCIKKISNEEIKLRNMIKELYPECEFQYPVFNYSLDVAIPDQKIVIEYDGYYHFDTEEHKEYHKLRQEKIEKEGWVFIKYTMFDKFPTLEKLKEDINKIYETNNQS